MYEELKDRRCVAVFGNEDFRNFRERYKEEYPSFTWLDDSSEVFRIGTKRVLVVGSEGVLQRPTRFQRLLGIDESYFKKRMERIDELLCEEADFRILVTHYASSLETVLGEKESIYPYLGYPLVEKVRCAPDIAIHGHAHFAKRTLYFNGKTKVYNVALPANQDVVKIDVPNIVTDSNDRDEREKEVK
ncbi:metallophosphoesterase family protein [Sulfuracidifex tepidarius]|uniref:metallophosphoesterase family protein n=1 Tax=Sulfuracidifex tepidarius TaxID=1294262 RepID=UPI0034E2C183